MNQQTKIKYFIALVTPQPVNSQIAELKMYISENYHCNAALRSPPHITLHMPFEWEPKKENYLVSKLSDLASRLEPVKIVIKDFGSFAPKVIFLNVLLSDEFSALQKEVQKFCRIELNLLNANYRDRTFHAHVTLAFRDLKKAAFKEAWKEFQDQKFSAGFTASSLELLRHTGKVWEIFHSVPFRQSTGISVP